jgi:O-antigen ligase
MSVPMVGSNARGGALPWRGGESSGVPGTAAIRGSLRATLPPFLVGMMLLVVLNVSRIHQHFEWMAGLRPALVIALCAVAYAYLNPRQVSLRGVFDTWPPRVIILLGLLACMSAPFGISLGSSGLFIIESYSKVIIGALLLVAAIRKTSDLRALCWAYVVGAGILSWFGIFVFNLEAVPGSSFTRLNDMYMFDANDAGVVLLAGMGLCLLLLQTAGPIGKVAALLVLVGAGVTLARSGSRGALVGLMVTGLALLLLVRTVRAWKRLALVAAVGGVLAIAAPAGYWEQMSTILRPTEDYNWTDIDGRKAITERGLAYMAAYPVFGLGINNFGRAECLEPVSDKVRYQGDKGLICTAPHNTYLQVGAELGFPGLALWLVLIVGGTAGVWRYHRRLPSSWRRGDPEQRFLYAATQYLPISMVGFAASSFFVSFAWIDIVYILAALTGGLLALVRARLAAETPAAPVSDAQQRLGARYRPSVSYVPR